MSITSLVNHFVKNPYVNAPAIAFYKDTAGLAAHGKVIATNKQLGLLDIEITFSVVGYDQAPGLDPYMLGVLWHRAQEQGYVLKRVTLWGNELTNQLTVKN